MGLLRGGLSGKSFFLSFSSLRTSLSIVLRESLTRSWSRALFTMSRSDAAISLWIMEIWSLISSSGVNFAKDEAIKEGLKEKWKLRSF